MDAKLNINNYLPPIPRPPHDPTDVLLNGRVGWREMVLFNVELTPSERVLSLAPLPGSGRSLTEKSGSFGGLTLPATVALGPGGNIYLLDHDTQELKHFDVCECRFEIVPRIGGQGKEPRQFRNAHGIAICGGNLYVCDTGNHRLSVFALHGFVLRGHWTPPSSAYKPTQPELVNLWEPYAVAFDGRGGVFVTDGANGCIHRFSPSGRWETCLPGFGKATFIAIDCKDRLYVVIEGDERSVRVVDTRRNSLPPVSRPEELEPHFPRLPFQVDAQGSLHLGELCATVEHLNKCQGPSQTRGIFDLRGNPVTSVADPARVHYPKEGTYVSAALDSKLYQCQWHRIILKGKVPIGSSIHVSTYTAEAELSDQISNLPVNAWETNQTAYQLNGGKWDCLIRSGGGRFLWLRLQLRGHGTVTPAIESVEIEFPRISLRRYLPAVFGEDPSGTNFTDRFLSIFDTTLRSIEQKIDTLARYFDPLSTPAGPDPKTGVDFLAWLGSWIGVTLDRHWPEAKRRQYLKRAARLYHIRGTREGLWRQLLFYLGMEPETACCANDQPKTRCHPRPYNCEPVIPLPCAWQAPPLILEHYQLRRWLFLGAGRIGDQAVLWGKRIVNRSQLDAGAQVGQSQLITTHDPYRDPFHVYAHKFSVFVPALYGKSDRHKKGLENLLMAESPAHTHYTLEYVEPRFRIGFQSMIGLDTVVGRYPEGVTVGESALGHGTVLGRPPFKQGGPSFEIGKESRVGSTTLLD